MKHKVAKENSWLVKWLREHLMCFVISLNAIRIWFRFMLSHVTPGKVQCRNLDESTYIQTHMNNIDAFVNTKAFEMDGLTNSFRCTLEFNRSRRLIFAITNPLLDRLMHKQEISISMTYFVVHHPLPIHRKYNIFTL